MSDFGVVTEPDTLRIERLLPGPIERVWAYLTESDKRARWLAAGPMALEPGGRVDLVFHNAALSAADDRPPPKYAQYSGPTPLSGQVTACEPPRLLAFTWNEAAGEPSEVRFELSSVGGRVRLVLTHTRLRGRDAMLSVAAGWHGHLAILDAHLAERPAESFWSLHTRLESEYERRIPAA
jgi:uncharacterized protein YndB with AHSA1/START domain